MESNKEVGERLLAAMLAADGDELRAVCSPDVEIVLNRSPVLSRDWLISAMTGIVGVMPGYQYENVRCSGTDDGFVHERDAVGTLADGTSVVVRACVVGTVVDGTVTSVREYFDSVDIAPVLQATSGN